MVPVPHVKRWHLVLPPTTGFPTPLGNCKPQLLEDHFSTSVMLQYFEIAISVWKRIIGVIKRIIGGYEHKKNSRLEKVHALLCCGHGKSASHGNWPDVEIDLILVIAEKEFHYALLHELESHMWAGDGHSHHIRVISRGVIMPCDVILWP